MYAVHVFDIYATKRRSIKVVTAPPEVAIFLTKLSAEKYQTISELSFVDQDLYNGDELLKLRKEFLELLEEVDDQQRREFLKQILDAISMAENLNLWILFNPFYEFWSQE